jgi:hypothetical protein
MGRIIGYHGTNLVTANKLFKDGFGEPTANRDLDWLGDGIYFFETLPGVSEGRKEAQDFSRIVKGNTEVGVIEAEITTSNCFDMVSEIEHRELFGSWRDELQSKWKRDPQRGSKPFDDRKVFALVCLKRSTDVVRCMVDGMPARGYNSASHVVHRPQIQICVKKRECVRVIGCW